jgi:phosphomannomutase
MLDPSIFKSNDIRGVVGSQWDVAGAAALGAAYAELFHPAACVVGRDTRRMGDELSQAFARAAAAGGVEAIDVGLVSTDELYFGSGILDLPGVQFTASHNPAEYNGAKFCLSGAAPVSADWLRTLAERAQQLDSLGDQLTGVTQPPADSAPARIRTRDLLPDYVAYLHSLIDTEGWPKLRVVVDAGNGMAGLTARPVLEPLGVEVIGLYLDLDPAFPNHPPNPLDPANLVDVKRAVVEQRADIGLAFDGDADRCFIIDERGEVVDPAVIVALVAQAAIKEHPGAAIVVNTITSRMVGEVVARAGGQLVVTKVGHTHIKAQMAAHQAVFGGEHSAHYYFREFWGADTGMLAALKVLALLAKSGGAPVSQLGAGLPRYFGSGEINTMVAEPAAVTREVADDFTAAGLGEAAFPDGLFISGPDWWVSVRESNTEPLLRLNVEASTQATMLELRDRALGVIRKGR